MLQEQAKPPLVEQPTNTGEAQTQTEETQELVPANFL